MKFLYLSLLFLYSYHVQAQNIYGNTYTLNQHHVFSSYGYHDNTITQISDELDCAASFGSDERSIVYYISACTPADVKLNGVDVVTSANTSVKMDKLITFTQFNNGTIWGIDEEEECLYQCDIATGKVSFYDSLFKKAGVREPEGKHRFFGSSFNPDKGIYYFTMTLNDDPGFWDSTVFCQYHIASKTLTRQRLPSQFFNFVYSPISDRALFASTPRVWKNGWVPPKTPGFYEYDINNNSLQLVYEDWSFNTLQPLMLDKVKNRVYFFYAYNSVPGGCTMAYFGSYRFYSRRFDTYNASGKLCNFASGVFLPTYNDTTWDGFPTDVPDVINTTGIQVYPNPAANVLHISFATGTDAPLYLTDMMGRVVLRATLQTGKAQLDVSKLATGQYILRIGSSNSRVSIVH